MDAAVNRALKILALVVMAIAIVWSSPSCTMAGDDAGGWHFTIQPYLWAPTIEMDLKLSAPDGSTGEPEIEVKPDDYLENLDIALIATAEARKGKWSLVADFVFMELSPSDSSIKNINFGGPVVSATANANVDVEMTSFISTFGGGYQLVDNPRVKMDLIAGLRYLWLEQEVEWNLTVDISGPGPGQTFPRSGKVKEDGDVWNGIGGLRGQILLGEGNWFIPFYGDIGAGDSDLTWTLFSGIGYTFKDWFDMLVGFRHMEWDNDDDKVAQKLKISGPAIGARFNF